MVAPSMLSADFGNLDRDIDMVNNSSASLFHLDIMDGVFVPNISYGFPVIKAIAKRAEKPLDAHLMIIDPDRYIERFKELGVEYLSIHIEACIHLHRSVQNIRNNGMKAGVALNPHTPVSALEEILEYTDFILLMSVNPGFGGQSFIPSTYNKIEKLRKMVISKGLNTLIEVDGGVTIQNAQTLYSAGADILVAGNSVFTASDPLSAITQIRKHDGLSQIKGQ